MLTRRSIKLLVKQNRDTMRPKPANGELPADVLLLVLCQKRPANSVSNRLLQASLRPLVKADLPRPQQPNQNRVTTSRDL